MKQTDTPRFGHALILVILLVIIFGGSIIGLGLSPYVPLLISLLATMIFAKLRRATWDDIQTQLLAGIQTALAPLFLFLLIGMLIALWMGTNVIPTMLWLGFNVANAAWLLPSALLVTAIVGSMIGSAFTTLATVGVALMGVGTAMGFSPALVAGAVLSGAIFGDKSSPLSDSTNLASSIAETDLFAHIKNLMWTTLPALVVSFIIFIVLGTGHAGASAAELHHLAGLLTPTWWTVVPLVLLVGMAWAKIPAIPTLLVNVGVTGADFLLNHNMTTLADVLLNGFKTTAKNDMLQSLLNRGGMLAMMPTVIIIMLALALGGL
ncbi:MAG: Na+/H+ antiporter NhaC family protein, partial [Weissella cibaria]